MTTDRGSNVTGGQRERFEYVALRALKMEEWDHGQRMQVGSGSYKGKGTDYPAALATHPRKSDFQTVREEIGAVSSH